LSVEELVFDFLKENPGSNPREIAEALGVGYNRIRAALYRLRERGLVIRTEKGYTVAYRAPRKMRREDKGRLVEKVKSDNLERLSEEIDKLSKKVSTIEKRISEILNLVENIRIEIKNLEIVEKRLNKEVELVKSRINKLWEYLGKLKFKSYEKDEFLSLLSAEKVLSVSRAKNIINKPLEEYISEDKVILVSSYVIDKEFYNEFKKLFPLPVDKVKNLDEKSKALLRAMVDEGLAYLHKGKEYRLI